MQLRPPPLLENIPLPGPASVTVREFRQSAFRRPWHQHPEVELTWILKGSGLRYVGDSVEPFRAGDFCLLGSNLPHTWLSPEGETKAVHSLVVQFDPVRWGATLTELPEFTKIADLFERAGRGLCFNTTVANRARNLLFRRNTPLGHFTALLDILEELAEQPARELSFAPQASSRRMNADPRIRVVLAFLSKNASSSIRQKDVAKLVRLSPAAFSRFFRRGVGKTFGAYLADLRLSEACRRLLDTNDSISRIAYDAGFQNLSNFNRCFRKARGMSPKAFRRQALSDQVF